MNQERIGLFGGTFDPIHVGHLILAHDALEVLQLDRLLFLPVSLSPYKLGLPPQASPEDRLKMLQLATEGDSRLLVDARELNRKGISYTIDTVRELEKEIPGAKFFYLLGEDHRNRLYEWKESEELKKKVTFAFFARGSSALSSGLTRRLDISSTEIRERCARGGSVSSFLSKSVFEYLEKNLPIDSHFSPNDAEQALALLCLKAAEDKKAEDPLILDLRGISTFTNYFVLLSGHSEPQLKAISNSIREMVRGTYAQSPFSDDFYPGSSWIVLDYGAVVVHIFHTRLRALYNLESLWGMRNKFVLLNT